MANRLLQAVTVLASAATLIAACSNRSTEPRSESSGPVAAHETAVATLATRVVSEAAFFTSPSGNIGCLIDMTYVRCDISQHNWPSSTRPADCDLEYGDSVAVMSGEPAYLVCHGDTVFGGPPLAYGDSIAAGMMSCDSEESGVTCRSADTGAGFTISREAHRLF